MKRKQIRHRLQPFRLLVMLYAGTYSWLDREPMDPRRFKVRISGLAQTLRVSRARLVEQFEWLQRMGYLTVLERTQGYLRAALETPLVFKTKETQNVQVTPSTPDADVG